MLSFRQKIFISYAIGFILFLLALLPLSTYLVRTIVFNAMKARSQELIDRIQHASNNEGLVKTLKDQKPLLFFRVSVITDTRKVLYDSHTKRLLGPGFSQEYVVDHPEVMEAMEKGIGYEEGWSDLLSQKFAYLAIAFDFHGKNYVLRTAFPYRYLSEMQRDFEIGFLALATLVLLIFSLMSWLILNHFTRPIERIIAGVRPYQEGKVEEIPYIQLKGMNKKDDFALLAGTLNSLNTQIKKQIETVRKAGIEKEVLLESLLEGVVAIDPDGHVTFANQSALNFIGTDKDSLISGKFTSEPLQKGIDLALSCQKEGVVLTDSLEIAPKNETCYLNLIAAPKKDLSGALLVLQDTTQEVKVLEMRKDFIANASHELKTPITIIRGFAEILHDNPGLSSSMTSEMTEKIVRNCERMETLIKDLIALADIENLPEHRLKLFDLFDILEKGKQTTLEVFKEAEINIHGDRPLFFYGDPDLLEMAVVNLINNAAKYSHAPAHIEIKAIKEGDSITLTVKDQGIGIPEKDIPRLFERFYRVDKIQSRKVGGSGLGLSIVQTAIKKHGGVITVTSKPGKGTTFTIKLKQKES